LKRLIFFIIVCIISLLGTGISYSAGMIMRVQQMKAQRQQQQGMTQAQAQQYQEYQEQQQGDHAGGQQPAAPPTYQQTVDQRNQAIAQAIISANANSQSTVNQGTGNNVINDGSLNKAPINPSTPSAVDANSSTVKDVVDLSEVWKKLDTKSTVWELLIDDQSKILTVSEYISRFQQEGVKISAPPAHYVEMIDQLTKQNPQMLDRPFGELIQMLAIIDYDFDNGMDRDVLARKVLGEQGYEVNKQRFTQAQQPQQQQ
jgi:hypothetical protein